jgi:hypothetical protein
MKLQPAESSQSRNLLIVLDALDMAAQAVGEYWKNIQVGHRGRYSVQRLLSFRDYHRRTSPTRVFFVCLTALVPAFVAAVLVECIPLKPPDEGWKANYMFWIRLYVSSLPIAFGAVYQVKEVIEPDVISPLGIAVTGVGSCTCYVAFTMVLAVVWKFPIPFGYVLTVAPFVCFYMAFFMLSIGPRALSRPTTLRTQLGSQMTVIAAQGCLAIAFPAFSAVFNQLSGSQQSAFIFVLPVIKFCIKQVIAKASAHLHECVGLIVVFSVDVCNVLYVVVCMQTAISPLTTTILITSDAFFVVLALRSIYYQSDSVQTQKALLSLGLQAPASGDYLEAVLLQIRGAFQDKASSAPVPIRVRSPISLPLSVESTRLMSELVHAKRRNGREADSFHQLTLFSSTAVRLESMRTSTWVDSRPVEPVPARSDSGRHQIVPTQPKDGRSFTGPRVSLAMSSRTSTRQEATLARSVSRHKPSSIVAPSQVAAVQDAQASLQTLFHSEYVVMAEFIEFAIPLLYAVYLAILYHLPTAAFYPHTRSLTPEKFARTLTTLVIYSSVELASFIGLNLLLKRKFGFSPVYQLAFVLETQVASIQGHLFLWILVILQITLVHNGQLARTCGNAACESYAFVFLLMSRGGPRGPVQVTAKNALRGVQHQLYRESSSINTFFESNGRRSVAFPVPSSLFCRATSLPFGTPQLCLCAPRQHSPQPTNATAAPHSVPLTPETS